MKENDFTTDITAVGKKNFLHRIGACFMAAICLTGLRSIAGILGIIAGIRENVWNEVGMASFVWKIFLTVIIVLLFCSLVKMAIDEKPFSGTLTWCIRIIGALFVLASLVIPRLDGYQPSDFRILSSGDFVLIDGSILIFGLLLIILGNIVMAGFSMQKEMNEIL
jgi:predicted transporter